ncbi:6,7-dimethyl-8-ribityllumazine synthase (riboflavin synthase, alpha subunit) [Campylobacter subantarcticus LMG 24377]|uniref:Riboflavin synthase n=2 Tax=Campylobacter subantarcticus TaxID=497724 RepID=A0A0A8HAJ5_9BACT|nr:riboflavin synthase [Campylobacter subantarcticus]EAJ1260577.1 riboflavin synthase [Campylobacter lari]AJC91096.1 6,7-dimethyl-8-ribityllumazine synthase (riboflavin synthase, alpha subunit) [Campylobacter subantarcticus LMG 24374]AJC92874.1 6,7-dimethyl-8-ribityllumazine synthase (riboflavin synthase, alpha subunit) [Campylobacter subantarcticus LMG 24377]EAL3938298.1 riboflavin synthase [Campylobacter lari]MPB99224.1 riboflavin synthase [Campylobacter subantarcticus]
MFNGLIRELAFVKSYENNTLRLKAAYQPKLGDSIAVNGACLSVTKLFDDGFNLELSYETRTRIVVENLKDYVHIEPALRYGDRIDGHLMQGHIDGIGEISNIIKKENGVDFYIKCPNDIQIYMANKASIGIDGVSLTINEVLRDGIRLTIIPITFKETLFKTYTIGRRVNIESDLLARYTHRQLHYKKEPSWQQIDKIISLY